MHDREGVHVGAKVGLRAYFGKTYYEKQGWAHCFHVFGRVFMWPSATLTRPP